MDILKLKQLENRMQILTVIEKASLFGGDIWQTVPGAMERHISHIVQIKIDPGFERIVFRTSGFVEMDPRYPIYIRLSYRSLIFRLDSKEFKLHGDKIICSYPQEARALEMRKGERYVLPFNSDISLSLKRVERNMRETTYDMELRIIDVSERGFGILISGQNRDYLKHADHFWLKGVDQRPLSHHIFGSVCYVAPKGYYLKKGDVRVGLSLNMALGQEIFEYLKKKCLIVLSA